MKVTKAAPTHYTMGIRENLNALDRAIQANEWACIP